MIFVASIIFALVWHFNSKSYVWASVLSALCSTAFTWIALSPHFGFFHEGWEKNIALSFLISIAIALIIGGIILFYRSK